MTIKVRIAWGEGPEQILMKMAGVSVVVHLVAIVLFSVVPRFTEAPAAPRATIAEIIPASAFFPPVPRGGNPAATSRESTPSQRAEAAKEAANTPAIVPPIKKEPAKPVKKPDATVPPPPGKPKQKAPLRPPEPDTSEPHEGKIPAAEPEQAPSGASSPAGISLGGSIGAGGVPSLGSSAFPYDYYRSSLVAILQSNWRRPVAPDGLRELVSCRVQFTIMKSGIVQDARIFAPSGNEALDQSALRAIYDSTPLPPLPIQYGHASVSAEVMFELTPD